MLAKNNETVPGTHSTPSWRKLLAIIVVVGGLLRLGLAARDIETLDRLFVPDDTYYTLDIARSMAQGAGPRCSHGPLTNGFQPLIAFMLVPAAALGMDGDALLRLAIVIGALADILSVILLGLLGLHLVNPATGLAAALVWAISPIPLINALCGLEVALATMLQLAFLLHWVRAPAEDAARCGVTPGVLAGLLMLARVDAAFLLVAYALIESWRGRPRALVTTIMIAIVVVTPWWAYSVLRFGTPVPESGFAIRQLVQITSAASQMGEGPRTAFSLGALAGGPCFWFEELRDFLFQHPKYAFLVGPLIFGLYGSVTWVIARRCPAPHVFAGLMLHVLCLLFFYPLYVGAIWFISRYYSTVYAFQALLIGFALTAAVSFLWDRGPRRIGRAMAVPALGGLAMATLAPVHEFVFATTARVEVRAQAAVAGYRETARAIFSQLPPGSVVGTMQSGAMAWLAPPGIRVVNLDGVVNGHAFRALRESRMGTYMQEEGLTHLADWQNNVAIIGVRAMPRPPPIKQVGKGPPHGRHQTLLFVFDPPLPPPPIRASPGS